MYQGTPVWMAGLQLCSMDWKASSPTGHCIERHLSTAASAWTRKQYLEQAARAALEEGEHITLFGPSEVTGLQSFFSPETHPSFAVSTQV